MKNQPLPRRAAPLRREPEDGWMKDGWTEEEARQRLQGALHGPDPDPAMLQRVEQRVRAAASAGLLREQQKRLAGVVALWLVGYLLLIVVCGWCGVQMRSSAPASSIIESHLNTDEHNAAQPRLKP